MSTESHFQIANFIWSICNLLRGPYKRNEYRRVILPLAVKQTCLSRPRMPKISASLKGLPDDEDKEEAGLLEVGGAEVLGVAGYPR